MSAETPAAPPKVIFKLPQGPTNPPKIKVIFRGFVIAELTSDSASIGALNPALKGAPCHKPIVHVFQITPPNEGGTGEVSKDITNDLGFKINVSKDFFLTVTKDPAKVQVFWKDKEPFNRLDELGTDKKDFRWFVDANEIHKRTDPAKRVTVGLNALTPTFTLNTGIFHSSKLSDGEVTIIRKESDQPVKKRFGRFSTEITARIFLGSEQSAHFINDKGIFTISTRIDPLNRYEIVFDCTCRSVHEDESDLALIYDRGIILDTGGKDPIPKKEKVTMEPLGESKEDLTPEVYCSGLNAGPPPDPG